MTSRPSSAPSALRLMRSASRSSCLSSMARTSTRYDDTLVGPGSKYDILTRVTTQLIADGSAKLASVPSGGAAAAGGAAAGGAAAGGAAAEEKKEEEKKEEGALFFLPTNTCDGRSLTYHHREGGVRRGYGLRPVRLSAPPRSPKSQALWYGQFRRSLSNARRVGGAVPRMLAGVFGGRVGSLREPGAQSCCWPAVLDSLEQLSEGFFGHGRLAL
jgi:hypothetical protein